MLKLVIQTNLSLILFLGHCCWRLRSFNSFAQFLDTAGKVVNIYPEGSQIKNYSTIFDRLPFIFGYLIQVVKEVGAKTRKQVFLIDLQDAKLELFLLCKKTFVPRRSFIANLLCTKKISCTISLVLYTKRILCTQSEAYISARVEHARGAWRPPWL